MTTPGYSTSIVVTQPAGGATVATGNWGVVGGVTTPGSGWVYSISQFLNKFGARSSSSFLYDSLDLFFQEGGTAAFVAGTALSVADSVTIAALNALIPGTLGPMQVSAPGITTALVGDALAAHAIANNRIAYVDLVDSGTASTLVTAAGAVTGQTGDVFSAAFAPWDIIPGLTPGTFRTVPPSARQAARVAVNDAGGISPNQAAAGKWGIARYVQALSQPAWSPTDLGTLNAAGVNVSKIVADGTIRTYGFRTLASQTTNPNWSWLNNSRLVMAIQYELDQMMENFIFDTLDGQLATIRAFEGAIIGVLDPWFQGGDLFGNTAAEAYQVDVGPAFNTVDTMAAGQLNAGIGLTCSEFAEAIQITISKNPITAASLV